MLKGSRDSEPGRLLFGLQPHDGNVALVPGRGLLTGGAGVLVPARLPSAFQSPFSAIQVGPVSG